MDLERSILKDMKAYRQDRAADWALWWCLFCIILDTCLQYYVMCPVVC